MAPSSYLVWESEVPLIVIFCEHIWTSYIQKNFELILFPFKENADISDFQVYDKHDNMLHGPKEKGKRIVSMQFMRKYIQFAKSISPQLTEESRNLISEEYVKLRAEDVYNKDTQTARWEFFKLSDNWKIK